ncbi:YheC/YheD family endospore coat-associated protein [Cytobacillus purgationiresistens]|uniref:Glutathione synthase/RimK-type ligase-like ATP-grasp enzyme n=1 Tax=Cytobacillus purgationiresistens TaxID=863449 RepID=A0ABU0ACI7_9BACI|nr:YheC/YheD family protein [Cytobacillus purgationiresistens]MDQ0268964.1 glutathione synthase/RimK-type ligase-like ATP-grasp enzyme [Cytobacillus purgationiresistens]
MSISFIPITIKPATSFQNIEEHRLLMSYSLAQYWNIPTSRPLTVSFGKIKLQVMIECSPLTKDEVFFSEGLQKELLLPLLNIKLIGSYTQKNHSLTIGPVIGLLTDLNESDENLQPNFRSIHSFCHELQEVVSDIGGFFFVFHPKDVTQEKIYGYYLQEDDWVKADLPLPDVVYNRIHSRKLEATKSLSRLKELLYQHNIPLFNDRFLSKEDVHQLLISEIHLKPHLPDTARANKETIIDFIAKYSSLFIKPIHGSQGRQIIRLTEVNNRYQAEYSSCTNNGGTRLYETPEKFIRQFYRDSKDRQYIVQQAIPLLTYKNRPLDFRVLCHKNFQEIWKATSAVARISSENQFVSNLAKGGEMMKPLSLLTQLFDRKTAIQQLALMKELAAEASSLIDQKTCGLFAELGIDIGVDEAGGLWIIEANSKPSKQSEDSLNKVRPSAKALVEYCTFLAFSKIVTREDSDDDITRNHDNE